MPARPESVSPSILNRGILRENHSNEQNNHCLVERVGYPRPEDSRAEQLFLYSNSIQVWFIKESVSIILEIHDAPVEADSASKAHVV